MSAEPAAVMTLTAAGVADATRGRVIAGSADRAIDGFSIDSRTLAPGDLFFAIRGERFDGHAFVESAMARGAIGAVVSERDAARGAAPAAVVVLVDDTTRALQALARHVRKA